MSSEYQTILLGHFIAAIIASLIVGCGAAYCAYIRNAVITHIQNRAAELGQSKLLDQGGLSPDLGTEMSRKAMRMLFLADILYKWRYTWIILVYLGCFGAAYLVTYQ